MAIENDGTTTPEGTGAVPGPDGPVTVEQTPGYPVGTGAVDGPGEPVTTVFGPSGQEPTGAAPDPEPITIDSAFAKVVKPTGRRAAEPTTTNVEVKQAAAGPASPSGADGH